MLLSYQARTCITSYGLALPRLFQVTKAKRFAYGRLGRFLANGSVPPWNAEDPEITVARRSA